MNLQKTVFLFICVVISSFLLIKTVIAKEISNGPIAQLASPKNTATLKAGVFNMTFRSKIDGSSQPLILKVPEGYSSEKKWPLLVTLHGLGDGPIIVSKIDSMVQIGPYGRGDTGYKDLGEKDVFECIEFAQKMFSIDPNRIYLCGFSMGGEGVFEMGLKYPDKWAACVPVCGVIKDKDSFLIENGNNLPFWVNAGGADEVVPAKSVKQIYETATKLGFKHWNYSEYKDMGHSFDINWSEIEKWLLNQTRKTKPSRVILNCDEPGKAYWLEIVNKVKKNETARIEAEITGQQIILKTDNVSDYEIYFNSAPVSASENIKVIENGDIVFNGKPAAGSIFKKSSINNQVQ